MQDVGQNFPNWMNTHQAAFDGIKQLVLSHQCSTMIDHENPEDRTIFVTCNMSDLGTDVMLLFGTSWEFAHPVAFELSQMTAVERNYPVHKKELLSIVKALKKWCYDSLGTHFKILTDHHTLKSFMTQCDLSQRQARWQEFLAQ